MFFKQETSTSSILFILLSEIYCCPLRATIVYCAPLTGGDLKISYKVPEKVQKFLFKSLGLVCRPFKLHNSTRSEIFCSTHCPTKSDPQVRSRFRAKHRLLDLPAVLIQQDGVGPHAKTGSAAPQSPHAVLGKIGVVRREISW